MFAFPCLLLRSRAAAVAYLRRTFASTYGNGRDWIPLIFEGRQPPLHENSPELRAVKTIFNRDNEVSETFANQPEAYRPIFMTDDGSIVAREWALGFMLGIGLRSEQWGKRVLLTQHRQLLIPILVCCEAASTCYLTGNVSREETAAPSHRPSTHRPRHRGNALLIAPPYQPASPAATRSRCSPAHGCRENVGGQNLWCGDIAYE